jgi:peptide chain release factor 1
MIPIDKLENLKAEFLDLQSRVSDFELMNDARKYKALMRRYKELDAIIGCYQDFLSAREQLSEAKHLLESDDDPEMQSMAKEEIGALETALEAGAKLRDLLIPSDPNDEKNAIIEIRAGTGGEEAALFVAISIECTVTMRISKAGRNN